MLRAFQKKKKIMVEKFMSNDSKIKKTVPFLKVFLLPSAKSCRKD